MPALCNICTVFIFIPKSQLNVKNQNYQGCVYQVIKFWYASYLSSIKDDMIMPDLLFFSVSHS